MKDRLLFLLKVLISLGLILFLFTRVDLSKLGQAVASANYPLLLLALLLYFGAMAVNVVKWQVLLRAQKIEVPLISLLTYYFVGLFFGNFVPTNVLGVDVARGYDLARYTERGAEAAVSVVVDRLIGLIAFLSAGAFMVVVAVFLVGRQDLRPLALLVTLLLLASLLLFAGLLSRRLRRKFQSLFRLPPFSKVEPLYAELSGAVQAYRHNFSALGFAFLLSLSALAISNLVNYLISLGLGTPLPLFYIFLFNPLVAFAPVLIPSLGGLGATQGAYDLFYSRLGRVVSPTGAFAVSVVMQVVIYLASLPGGFLWWRKRRLPSPAMESEEVWEGEVSG